MSTMTCPSFCAAFLLLIFLLCAVSEITKRLKEVEERRKGAVGVGVEVADFALIFLLLLFVFACLPALFPSLID